MKYLYLLAQSVMCFLMLNQSFELKSQTPQHLDINEIDASFTPSLTHFYDNQQMSIFEVPKGSGLSTVFSSSFWIGGQSAGGVYTAAALYESTNSDFQTGPISDPSAYALAVADYHRIWKISRADIQNHINQYQNPGYSIPTDILEWPAHGDVSLGQASNLAPFIDVNNSGVYEPEQGDYPKIKGDLCLYWIMNDEGVHHLSGSNPMGIEIHTMAYAFNCPSSQALEHTVFMNYRIINRRSRTFSNTVVGQWTDFDIGGYQDDYMGCHVPSGTYYAHNGDAFDEGSTGQAGYQNSPPAMGVTLLAGPLLDADGLDNELGMNSQSGYLESVYDHGFEDGVIDNERSGLFSFLTFSQNNFATGFPSTATGFYNVLRSKWLDGTNLVYGANGHISNPSSLGVNCRYMFPGSSDDTYFYGTSGNSVSNWSELTVGNTPNNRHGVGSSRPFTFEPGSSEELDLALVYAREINGTPDPGYSVPALISRVQEIKNMFELNGTPCGVPFSVGINVPEPESLEVYPNPASHLINIQTSEEIQSIILMDVSGKTNLNLSLNSIGQIDVSQIPAGYYLLQIELSKGSVMKRLVITR